MQNNKNRIADTWTDSELKFLMENHKKLSTEELGKALGRSPLAVSMKPAKLKKAKVPDGCVLCRNCQTAIPRNCVRSRFIESCSCSGKMLTVREAYVCVECHEETVMLADYERRTERML